VLGLGVTRSILEIMKRSFGFLATLVVLTAPAAAQTVSYEARWLAVQDFLREQGYDLFRSRVEVVTNGDTSRMWVDLQAGSEYVLIGMCDDRCEKLDLGVSDFYHQPVAPNVDFGDASLVLITAERSDRYRLRGEPVSCGGASCIVALAVFRRDGILTAARRRP
jgi:hypothetical protein